MTKKGGLPKPAARTLEKSVSADHKAPEPEEFLGTVPPPPQWLKGGPDNDAEASKVPVEMPALPGLRQAPPPPSGATSAAGLPSVPDARPRPKVPSLPTAPVVKAPGQLPQPAVADPAARPEQPPAGAAGSKAPDAPPQRRKMRLGELLVSAGVVKDEDVMRALGVQKMGGGRLGKILVNLKLCTEDAIRDALAKQFDVNVVELAGFSPKPDVLQLMPTELIRKYEAVPIKKEDGVLWIAMMDPYNLSALDDIKFATGVRKLNVVTCTESDFNKFIEENLATQSLMAEILSGGEFYERAVSSVDTTPQEPEETDDTVELVHELKLAGEQPPIITLCNFLLVEAIRRRASDIHVEPYETYLRVRMRVDGALHTILTPPERLHMSIVARFKIMAEMDISKRRIPQDGHIAIGYQGETVHYRVSSLPTVYGEKVVIRLLKKEQALHALDSLGFDDWELKTVKKCFQSPHGLLLVTGPTGSGKTTTVHAGLNFINEPEVNIVTLEDPVEASLDGINHVQTNNAAGLTFSSGLRSILRQDPDVVFVGEVRDPEVANITMKAALTGHLVVSTLHTNSAAESLARLADLDIPSYLIANALVLIIAQRLVRRVCTECAEPMEVTEEEVDEFDLTPDQLHHATPRAGTGCDACMNSGYRGRLPVYEILEITNDMRPAIRAEAPVDDILKIAKHNGMRFLRDSGVVRALEGKTTLKEVRRVLSDAH